jgi:hypothetical protein
MNHMKKIWLGFLWLLAQSAVLAAGATPHGTDAFLDQGKKTYAIWHNVAFYSGGDLGQYQQTMSQNRDQVRRELLNELTDTLGKIASTGAQVDGMLESTANIILMFDEMHDLHKARDLQKINFSIENRFKAALDAQFQAHDVRTSQRKVQFSRGVDPEYLSQYFQASSAGNSGGHDRPKASLKYALSLYSQIDFVAYGTFSPLGGDNFQLTLQLQNTRTGVSRSFLAQGALLPAVDQLAGEVFDLFQRNEFPDWESPARQLQWLAMPANPAKANPRGEGYGYTFQEARSYCLDRGYRLPYARELLAVETGGAYKAGGIDHLESGVAYAVMDRRHTNEYHVLHKGEEQGTGGAIQALNNYADKLQFWCVKGAPSAKVLFFESLWRLHRRNQQGDGSNKDVFAAVETLRFELGDFDTGETYYNNLSTNDMFEKIKRYYSADKALEVLHKAGIAIEIPDNMR